MSILQLLNITFIRKSSIFLLKMGGFFKQIFPQHFLIVKISSGAFAQPRFLSHGNYYITQLGSGFPFPFLTICAQKSESRFISSCYSVKTLIGPVAAMANLRETLIDGACIHIFFANYLVERELLNQSTNHLHDLVIYLSGHLNQDFQSM